MNVAIVGSRGFPDLERVEDYVFGLPLDVCLISGGARGVDTAVEEAAGTQGLCCTVMPADWERFGKQAGYIRNVGMVAKADKVVAFWDGRSKGTRHTIDLALQHGKDLEVHFP